MRDILVNLSEEQVDWEKRTGFGGILDMRIEKYPHRLGYNVVVAFKADECSLSLKLGNIEITEDIVHITIELPKRIEKVMLCKEKAAYDI